MNTNHPDLMMFREMITFTHVFSSLLTSQSLSQHMLNSSPFPRTQRPLTPHFLYLDCIALLTNQPSRWKLHGVQHPAQGHLNVAARAMDQTTAFGAISAYMHARSRLAVSHLSRRKCDLVLACPSICSCSSRVISQALYITDTPGRTITSHLSLNTFLSLIFFKGCANCEPDGEIRGDCSFLLYILRGETMRKRLISRTPSESRCFHLICFPSEARSVVGALGQVWVLSPLGENYSEEN